MWEQDSLSVDKVSVRDQAELLLSIADIARCEIITCPTALQDGENPIFPGFPRLSENNDNFCLAQRTESYASFFVSSIETQTAPSSLSDFNRKRTISIDSPVPSETVDHPESPIPIARSISPTDKGLISPSSPRCLRPQRNQPLRLPSRLRRGTLPSEKSKLHANVVSPAVGRENFVGPAVMRAKQLQGDPPKEVCVKKIVRRKFSWKNYPELEQFLVSNREEYLHHSALNYTLQQKQYNNRLTESLLELATENGYMFDDEFNFVTVRDRIRCYYKSFVQSAKKRGILMGYAARKAGRSSDDEAE